MARRVFFSFHYQNDIWRVSQVRNSNITKEWEANKYLDAASWESVRRKGDAAVTAWIDRQINGTGVTVVLIGAKTAERRFVRYEIEESHNRGNGMLGFYIHRLKNQHGRPGIKGRNPFLDSSAEVEESFWGLWTTKETRRFSEIYPTYDWVADNGYQNINKWIEDAAKKVGR